MWPETRSRVSEWQERRCETGGWAALCLVIGAGDCPCLAPASVLPIDTWTTGVFDPNANVPGIAGKFANPDGDAFVNLLEYAFGTDPLNPNSGPCAARSAFYKMGASRGR